MLFLERIFLCQSVITVTLLLLDVHNFDSTCFTLDLNRHPDLVFIFFPFMN